MKRAKESPVEQPLSAKDLLAAVARDVQAATDDDFIDFDAELSNYDPLDHQAAAEIDRLLEEEDFL